MEPRNTVFSHNGFHEKDGKLALILTNSPSFNIDFVKRLWSLSNVIYCADGSANRLYDSLSVDRERYLPQAICGDLDSIRDQVSDYYSDHGVNLIKVYDQDNHDIDKCLDSISKLPEVAPDIQLWTVLLVCPFGGRYDHEIALISSSFRWLNTFHRVALVSQETFAHALPAGRSELIFNSLGYGPYCGLAALTGEATVSTTGLRWNLQGHLLKMGVLTSTSNELSSAEPPPHTEEQKELEVSLPIAKRVVTIETSVPIYWICSISVDNW